MRIAGGVQRVRYRNGKDEPAPPGDIVRLEVDCWASLDPPARQGPPARRGCPRPPSPASRATSASLEPNDTTGDDRRRHTNRILHDAEHPSHVVLPVVPARGRARSSSSSVESGPRGSHAHLVSMTLHEASEVEVLEMSKSRPLISLMLAVPMPRLRWPGTSGSTRRATELWNLGTVIGMEIDGAPIFSANPRRTDGRLPRS